VKKNSKKKPVSVKEDGKMNLQKFIAHAGITSRRKAEELILAGQISVNGEIIKELGVVVDPEHDAVKYKGAQIRLEQKVYLVMNKPEGTVSTASDDKGRRTVIGIVERQFDRRLYPVGRLDFNTTGCLIVTNDGDWAYKIIHPKFEIEKRYIAKIKGRISKEAIERLKKGVKVEDRMLKAVDAGLYQKNDKNDIVQVKITEGINHQVKLMLKAVGMPAIWLKRLSVGMVEVGNLAPGEWRFLTKREIEYFDK